MATIIPGKVPAFYAQRDGGTAAITSSADTVCPYNAVAFDNTNAYSTSTYRFTPQIPGFYSITVAWWFESFNAGPWLTYIYKNGSNFSQNGDYSGTTYVGPHSRIVTATLYLNGTTDYVQGYYYVGGSSSQTYYSSSRTYFTGHLVAGAQ